MRAAKKKKLMQKYGDEEIVRRLMGRVIWQGETEEQLIDSLGRPIAVDNKVLKTKTKQIWKYNQTAKNRYSLRVTLEDGVVVGWDKKG
jgi:uncharacterized membrane protein